MESKVRSLPWMLAAVTSAKVSAQSPPCSMKASPAATLAILTRSFGLVPGAGGNAGYWRLVVPLLQQAGYDSVAVSLPNWPGATFADHADAIVCAAGTPADVTLVDQWTG